MRQTSSLLPVALLAATVAACDDDPAGLSRSDVAGNYHAVELMVYMDELAWEDDLLARGASIDVTLHDDGTTSGQLVMPSESEEGVDATYDLAGTWQIDGDEVVFDHEGDTVLESATLTWADDGIIEGRTFTFPSRFFVRLSRGDPVAP